VKIWLAAAGLTLCLVAAFPATAQEMSVAEFFSSRVPRWFPVPKIPVDNPITEAKVELGRWLFYDERLSGNGTYSCGSCHQQALAFTDGLAHAIGSTGQHHSRSTMSLTNVVYNASFGWDARKWSLEAQMEVPMYNEHPIEMGLKGREIEVLARFTKHSRDLERFRAAFPGDESPISVANIIKAIASFERVLVSADSPFDRYLYSDDRTDMTASARRGVALFFSDRLRCSECHGSVNMSGPTIFAGAMPSDPEAFFHDTGVAAKPAKFRAPSLRNIAVTAPYMHDGSLGTLKDVVQHYARGGRPRPEKSDRVRGFAISPEETEDLVAFLRSLTDERFLTNLAFSNPHLESSLRGQR
jgi:cytochrome c peroxidase